MFFQKSNQKSNLREIRIEEITYHKLCILLEEEGYETFSELIEELLKK